MHIVTGISWLQCRARCDGQRTSRDDEARDPRRRGGKSLPPSTSPRPPPTTAFKSERTGRFNVPLIKGPSCSLSRLAEPPQKRRATRERQKKKEEENIQKKKEREAKEARESQLPRSLQQAREREEQRVMCICARAAVGRAVEKGRMLLHNESESIYAV